jgi:hypothetical protein
MAVTISQLCRVFAVIAVIGGAIGLPTTAYSKNQLGPGGWDPGGGDFRWRYGGLGNCGCWTHGYGDCVARRRTLIDRRGYCVVRWQYYYYY